MRQAQTTLTIETRGIALYDFTHDVARAVTASGIATGLATLFCRHTSASLLIQENADATVQVDLLAYFARVAPEDEHLYTHRLEGRDDMPAHLRAALTQSHLAIPIGNRHLLLGTWQGIYLFEHRRMPHSREVVVHVIGE
ncbi:secondary thiamine-phosphate synthase enzyme YjbQ [Methylovirgula sp. 4M-Z18]|uniref:secondary thiamine-phosphate synthase enzyme YjbQ n=1 Tax=Methylovirgula sp. 4M-Z18 TaxID=2293567 RepID=UPI000E2E6AD6|nr:secondary thiamine-phosphate synthase enzyme YjbQ [Methylovirgula sp. 4M-Z18]RFB80124.1 YjbQ family protein [Methylovirgula sp. 4M-Z18]